MFKARKSRKVLYIVLGGRRIGIERLGPEQGVELCLLVGPYIPKLRRVLKVLRKDLDPQECSDRLYHIAQTMGDAPGDFLEFVGLLIGRRPEWIAENTTALELVEILPQVAEYQGLWQILALGSALGLFDLGE